MVTWLHLGARDLGVARGNLPSIPPLLTPGPANCVPWRWKTYFHSSPPKGPSCIPTIRLRQDFFFSWDSLWILVLHWSVTAPAVPAPKSQPEQQGLGYGAPSSKLLLAQTPRIISPCHPVLPGDRSQRMMDCHQLISSWIAVEPSTPPLREPHLARETPGNREEYFYDAELSEFIGGTV